MVSGSRIVDGGPQVLSAGVRRTIQSIKEIVGNHSDADIYVALKETNMDPNETTQKLLNQDPFHEVKRKRDRKKEVNQIPEHKRYVAAGPRKITEPAPVPPVPVKNGIYSDRNTRRGGSGRNVASGAAIREFRVVRDNRLNHAGVDSKLHKISNSKNEMAVQRGSLKSNSTEQSGHQKPLVAHNPSQAYGDSQRRRIKDSTSSGNDQKESPVERRLPTPIATSRMHTKANSALSNPTSSSNFVAGVYSSSSDPVHVPSPHSRLAANVGAIRRDVGVVGPRRQSSEKSAKQSSQIASLPSSHSGQVSNSQESRKSHNVISDSDKSNQHVRTEPSAVIPDLNVRRSYASNQHASRPHQFTGHQKAPQPNKEWKPKSSPKPGVSNPGVIGNSAKTAPAPLDEPDHLKNGSAQIQDDISRLNISENQNVIIAPHIRVSETDRCRLTFGSLGTNLDASVDSICTTTEGVEISAEPSGSVSGLVPESPGDALADGNQLEMIEDPVRSSESDSPSSGALHDHKSIEKNESSSQHNSDSYAEVGLVQDNSAAYTPEPLQHQNNSLPGLSGYDPQVAYEVSYLRPSIGEAVREPGLPSSQEVLNTHTMDSMPTSTVAMVQQQQQQQQQLAQMYPQLHVSHFANLMPYRQFISPVYVPPMPVPGYSNNPAYTHPSNGSSYLLMPGNSSHLTPSGIKYGVQQFKHVPAGSQTGFGNFTSPTGYAVNTPGVVGGAVGHDDSSRLKYKDNLYVPNPQAETSEIWMSPRDLPGLQSASYYNMPGPTPHPAYLTSHGSHASFNTAAQSSHMQFQGMYHPPPQPGAIASPHHMGPAIGGNVGVGVAAPAPGAQVGAYQQPQLGHFNWTGNF